MDKLPHLSNRLSLFSCTLSTLCVQLAAALPLPRGEPFSVDSGQDAWAEALSGVGPLILLIGEKNTKQLLREAHGLASILSMSFAPIGLLSVLTSMIRVCGSQQLRSYLGYEHEPRANAALEMTRVNCGGVHAEVVDGFISRSTVADSPSRALAVALIQGDDGKVVDEALEQIRECYMFQSLKMKRGCPKEAGDVSWCFRVVCPVTGTSSVDALSRVIAVALGMEESAKVSSVFSQVGLSVASNEIGCATTISPTKAEEVIESTPNVKTPSTNAGNKNSSTQKPTSLPVSTPNKESVKHDTSPSPTLPQVPPSPNGSDSSQHHKLKQGLSSEHNLPKPLKTSFMCTFDGVSELNASHPTPRWWSLIVATSSLVAMLAIQILCLWQEDWYSSGIVMVIVGYFCMAGGVSLAAYLIYSSCDSATMKMRTTSATARWTHGLVIDAKNTDSLDTTGSRLMQAKDREHLFEAVWLKEPTRVRNLLSWVVAIFLTLAFVCYYLGLRSVAWWVSVTQLLVCLVAAFLRSMSKIKMEKFQVTQDIRLDKRCYSTGVLNMQRASRIKKGERKSEQFDLRIYSLQSSGCIPLTGEFIAWRAAKLCTTPEFKNTGNAIISTTGVALSILASHSPLERNVIATFQGGVITEEGLAFPNATLCLAFPTSLDDIAAPTPLLARAVMRQAQWYLTNETINKSSLPFLGGMYISSFDSMVTWWSIAEDRNGMGDQHKNLHGSFLLICTAFFLALLRGHGNDRALVDAIDKAHARSSEEDQKYAKSLVEFLKDRLG